MTRSEDDKVSRGMWKIVEASSGKLGWKKQKEEEVKEEAGRK